MSKVNQLAHRIRSLPDIDAVRSRVAVTRRVKQDAKSVVDALSKSILQAPYIDELARTNIVPALREAIIFSSSQAKMLKKLVQITNFGSEQKISEHLDNLLKKMQSLETLSTSSWAKVQGEIRSVQTVLDIARALSLGSVVRLEVASSTFKKTTASAPSSSAETDLVKQARENSNAAIANSGLTGNVKKILEGAIAADGDPRLLLEDDVQTFLKTHTGLWDLLKLKLA